MRHAHLCMPQSSTRLFWAATVLAACFLKLSAATTDDESVVTRNLNGDAEDSKLQLGGLGVIKRDWDKNLQMWGKRGWAQLSGHWGKKKRSISPAWEDEDSLTIPVVQKRSWQRLHGGWGKRTLPYSDDNEVRDISSILDQQDNNNIHVEPESDYDFHVDEKRKWKQFSDGWGKRANDKWNNFRGSWGKRDPSWVNLKGMWGKRSSADYLSTE